MNNTPDLPDADKLSDDDLAVLQAFATTENLVVLHQEHPTESEPEHTEESDIAADMLVLFVTEADDEIALMQQTLQQLGRESTYDSSGLMILKRAAHKLKGTAGAVGYECLTTIARFTEQCTEKIDNGMIDYEQGIAVLTLAVQALATTLYSIANTGQESNAPLLELKTACDALNIPLSSAGTNGGRSPSTALPDIPPLPASMPVDNHHLERLLQHIEQLAIQRTPVELAQAEVEKAQQELQAAQTRLQRLEMQLFTLPRSLHNGVSHTEPPMSSLVAHILNESMQRTGYMYRRKNKPRPRLEHVRESQPWDELEIDPYTRDELLLRSLSEAIADVATASAQVRAALEHLNIALQKHMAQTTLVQTSALLLRHPYSEHTLKGLLVRAGDQRVVIPFSQLQHIDYEKGQLEPLCMLHDLLGFPPAHSSTQSTHSILVLQYNGMVIEVDEILGDIEFVMKPLAAHLQRPGVAGTATDGMGHVLLILDMPELLMHTDKLHPDSTLEITYSIPHRAGTILIADDSVYIRQSVRQVLSHAGYAVLEAHDGTEALEQLLANAVDVLLLDIEMPNLNGYDLLTIIHANPRLTHLKVAMLTSRSSEKHQRRAKELGAHSYLTKPCSQDTLLATIRMLLVS